MANVEKFKYWCNKILPLVYDDSLSYYEFLGKVYEKLNETIDAVNANTEAVAAYDQRINDFIESETDARESWEDAEALKWAAFQAMFINAYDPDNAYVQDDLCSYQQKMYVANAATTGPFDPSKWTEIVLSDYLSDYVADAKAEMQDQYDDFLEDYQRQFGVVQSTGTSTTDVMSQKAVTSYGFQLYLLQSETDDLNNCYTRGIYEWPSSPIPANCPFNTSGTLIVFTRHIDPETSLLRTVQLAFDQLRNDPHMWYRYDTSSGWSDWHEAATVEYVDGLHNSFGFDVSAFTSGTPDLDTINRSMHYWTAGHAPLNAPEAGAKGFCATFNGYTLNSAIEAKGTIQLCVQSKGVYIRSRDHAATSFRPWALIQKTGDSWSIENKTFNSTTANYGIVDINDSRPMHFWLEYQGHGSFKITLYSGENAAYSTGTYYVDSGDEIRHLEITVPMAVRYVTRCNVIVSGRGTDFNVLKGRMYRENVCKKSNAIIFNDHCGVDGLYPTGSYNGVEYASKMGFESCIVIPKRTSDGVWVCFHDDDSIGNMMRLPNGDPIPEEYDLPVSSLTYAQLMQFSIGAKKSVDVFGSYKILTMDNFFKICSRTGLRPIFSIHPNLSDDNWTEINVLLKKWGLYGMIGVKSSAPAQLTRAKANTSVYEYILIYPQSAEWNIVNALSGTTLDANDKVIVEFFHQAFDNPNYAENTNAQFEAIKTAGYIPSLVIDDQSNTYIMDFINRGMREFTTSGMYNIYNTWD